jgi:hypothetical protein
MATHRNRNNRDDSVIRTANRVLREASALLRSAVDVDDDVPFPQILRSPDELRPPDLTRPNASTANRRRRGWIPTAASRTSSRWGCRCVEAVGVVGDDRAAALLDQLAGPNEKQRRGHHVAVAGRPCPGVSGQPVHRSHLVASWPTSSTHPSRTPVWSYGWPVLAVLPARPKSDAPAIWACPERGECWSPAPITVGAPARSQARTQARVVVARQHQRPVGGEVT